jgi:hypothetical protein
MDPNSHYEVLKKICEEGNVKMEERPKQKWGANYKGGAVVYNVLRLGGNRCDFLFDEQGKLISISN